MAAALPTSFMANLTSSLPQLHPAKSVSPWHMHAQQRILLPFEDDTADVQYVYIRTYYINLLLRTQYIYIYISYQHTAKA